MRITTSIPGEISANTMTTIIKTIEVTIPIKTAFDLFVNKLTLWWPQEYTWSKDKLVELVIDPIPHGLCTEIGPNGFRCDWGTVMEVEQGKRFAFKWQISASRVPEPDANKASEVYILFEQPAPGATRIQLTHGKFENHGNNYTAYRDAMASEQGWPYILSAFASYAVKSAH
ncbi:Uncharacterized conserved protein YndB, AHSA1/START domain [Parapedobacter luteus]|uniref:Uncharacterized conserved protein YndB, AHSA1/START domain n=1 Tax=Parapedobacter luteus TaxID=623280 RepID=A0A1T5AM70_9SPHI|nr:SRPBCC family protein [Parapedobacter luteus]SKB35929.1 Uncharacterized conserved protein YndB, AHSA1/START domain [Parapedobacter luteus]